MCILRQLNEINNIFSSGFNFSANKLTHSLMSWCFPPVEKWLMIVNIWGWWRRRKKESPRPDINGDQVPIFVLSQPDTLSQLDLGVDVDLAQGQKLLVKCLDPISISILMNKKISNVTLLHIQLNVTWGEKVGDFFFY